MFPGTRLTTGQNLSSRAANDLLVSVYEGDRSTGSGTTGVGRAGGSIQVLDQSISQVILFRLTDEIGSGKYKGIQISIDPNTGVADDMDVEGGAVFCDEKAPLYELNGGTGLYSASYDTYVMAWQNPTQEPGFVFISDWTFTDHDTPGVISLVDQTIGDGIKSFQQSISVGFDTEANERTGLGQVSVFHNDENYCIAYLQDDTRPAIGDPEPSTVLVGYHKLLFTSSATGATSSQGFGGNFGTVNSELSMSATVPDGTGLNPQYWLASYNRDAFGGGTETIKGLRSFRFETVSDDLSDIFSGTDDSPTVGPKYYGGIIYEKNKASAIADLGGGSTLSDAITAINAILQVLRDAHLIDP